MDLTSGARTTAIAAVVAMLAGLSAVLYGIAHHDVPRAIGGFTLIVTALTVIGLLVIRGWVTNTAEERRSLAETQRHAERLKDTYLAERAALENERGRLVQDMAAERATLADLLKSERAAMEAEFAERRDDLIAETMEVTFLMHRDGKFAPDPAVIGKLIRFPDQQPQRERPRGHGVVRP